MKKHSILLIDDDPLITRGTGKNLETYGYMVTTAGSGEDAIEILNNNSFDLIITDLVMEPLDGFDVLKKSIKIAPDTPVIILTGYGDMDSAIKALRYGADDFLLKPCSSDEMFFRISRCLNKYEIKRRLIKAEKELLESAKHESFSVFSGGLAHDFNNLLYVIMGYLSLIKDEIDPDSIKCINFLNEIEAASIQAKNLTQQFLLLSKGGYPITVLYSIEDILKKSIQLIPSDSDIKTEILIQENLRKVEVDPEQMKHAFNNLIINAYESMKNSGTITIKAENFETVPETAEKPFTFLENKYVKISIKDQGNGIDSKILSRIFDPYFTTKQRDKRKGMGMGLATTHSIIKKHSGHIFVESEPGKGTCFTIYLPAYTKEIQSASSTEFQPEKTQTNKIMLIDEEPMGQKLVCTMLEKIGYEYHAASNGEEAVEEYKKAMESGRPFDLVILDIIVKKGMEYMETLTMLRRINPDIKVILSSSYPEKSIPANYKDSGFKAVLSKPYTIKYLNEVINRVKNG